VSEIEPVLQTATLVVRQLSPFAESLPRCQALCRDGMQCMFSARYAVNDVPICGSHVGRPSLVFVRPKRKW
jgi:hypothetical protein